MAVFTYTGVAVATGKSVKGVRDAESPKALRAVLRREGVLLSSASEESEKKAKKKGEIDVFAIFKRAGTGDVAVMTRQLATLVRAGIPLVDSIAALTEQLEKQDLKRIMTAVRERLNEGSSFSKALEAHTRVFPPLYINMVAAGEASGTLESVLERLADFMEAQARLKGKVGAALAYPVLMTMIGILLMSVMMIAVVPKVTSIFQSLDHPLPWYTQGLIFTSSFLAGWWWLLILLGALGYYLFQRWVKTKEGRMKWDTLLLRLPIFGKLLSMLAISRFAKTLSTLLASGVPLLKAMEIVRNVLGNACLEAVVAEAAGSIREGETIADPLRRSGRFPPIVTHMIAVGEKSGQLEQMLSSVSDSYDAQVEVRVQAMTSLLEPIIIVVMGGAVGFIAFAILMPLIQMNEFVNLPSASLAISRTSASLRTHGAASFLCSHDLPALGAPGRAAPAAGARADPVRRRRGAARDGVPPLAPPRAAEGRGAVDAGDAAGRPSRRRRVSRRSQRRLSEGGARPDGDRRLPGRRAARRLGRAAPARLPVPQAREGVRPAQRRARSRARGPRPCRVT